MDKIKITVQSDNKKVTYEIPSDYDISEYKSLFTEILLFLTFHPETIKDLFNNEEE